MRLPGLLTLPPVTCHLVMFVFMSTFMFMCMCTTPRSHRRFIKPALRFFRTYVGLVGHKFGVKRPTYLPTYLPGAASGRETYLPTYLPSAASGRETYLPTYLLMPQ